MIINICFCDLDSIILYGVIFVLCCGILFKYILIFIFVLFVIFVDDDVKLVVFIFWILISVLDWINFKYVLIRSFFINGFFIWIVGCFVFEFLDSFFDVNVVLWILLWLVDVFMYIIVLLVLCVCFFLMFLWLIKFMYIVFISGFFL